MELIKKFGRENRRFIFMDGEFADLTSNGVKLLSIALIADNGQKLYLELNYREDDCSPWVKRNVIPFLRANKVSKFKAVEMINKFVRDNYGDEQPVLVADVNQFDWLAIKYLYDTHADEIPEAYRGDYSTDIPFFYIPLDLSTLMWTRGLDIDCSREGLAKELGMKVDILHQHYALDDAEVVKFIFDKLIDYIIII